MTVEVVNSNGVVMPYTTLRESATQNRYRYILVPGETYHYVATRNTYYHITDDFSLEEVANSTIIVDFSSMSDWLTNLGLREKSRCGLQKFPENRRFLHPGESQLQGFL